MGRNADDRRRACFCARRLLREGQGRPCRPAAGSLFADGLLVVRAQQPWIRKIVAQEEERLAEILACPEILAAGGFPLAGCRARVSGCQCRLRPAIPFRMPGVRCRLADRMRGGKGLAEVGHAGIGGGEGPGKLSVVEVVLEHEPNGACHGRTSWCAHVFVAGPGAACVARHPTLACLPMPLDDSRRTSAVPEG